MKKERMFIAVEIDDDIRHSLTEVQASLMATGADVKLVEPNNIHLTIKFLGDTDPQLTVSICEVIEEATKGVAPFSVSVVGLGTFPPKGTPRIIWAGVTDESKSLARIYNALNSGLVPLGTPYEERPFHAHITLGRLRSPRTKDAVKRILQLYSDRDFGSIMVERLTLFASELTQRGPVYTPLATVSLSV